MYLTTQRVRRIRGEKAEVGINAFLYRHEEPELPEDMQENKNIIDQIAYENRGKLIAESVDLVPGGNSVPSFVDIVGREGLNTECIQDFLDQMESDIEDHFQDSYIPITKSIRDIAVKFGITYGLQGQEIREYKALKDRAMHLFQSQEPPRWRTGNPWIVIHRNISHNQETFSLSPDTVEKLRQMHDELGVPKRVSIDHRTQGEFEFMHGDLISNIAPILTDLTLEQIAIQGGLILHDQSTQRKIKWPELREI